MVNVVASHARGRRFAPRTKKNLPFFLHFILFSAFCILFSAFCYFQEPKLFHYIFLKTCAVRCEVIQLLYSYDQYPLNGQMHTGTGSANGQMHTGTGSALVFENYHTFSRLCNTSNDFQNGSLHSIVLVLFQPIEQYQQRSANCSLVFRQSVCLC